MRIGIALSLALVVGLAAVGSVWAFSRPTLVKAANEAIAGLMKDALVDVSPENRATIAAIGRDLVGMARKNLLGVGPGQTLFPDRSLEARKELTAMGLTYHDSKQFLEAVKRNDTLAAMCLGAIVWVVGGRRGEPARAVEIGRIARVVAARVPDAHEAHATLANNIGICHLIVPRLRS